MDLAKLNVLYNCGSNYYKGSDILMKSSLPESENIVPSEEGLFPKPGIEKETSPSRPEKENFTEEGLFSKSGTERKTSSKLSEEQF